jgi:hypothetical protein
MERAKDFLESNQKVFLLHGDSVAGLSTFNHELEIDLWRSYKENIGRIPLLISLPTTDEPGSPNSYARLNPPKIRSAK